MSEQRALNVGEQCTCKSAALTWASVCSVPSARAPAQLLVARDGTVLWADQTGLQVCGIDTERMGGEVQSILELGGSSPVDGGGFAAPEAGEGGAAFLDAVIAMADELAYYTRRSQVRG